MWAPSLRIGGRWCRQQALFLGVELDAESAASALGDVDGVAVAAADLVEDGSAREISFVIPFGRPVPPSPDTSAALETEFARRGITFIPGRRVSAVDPARSVAALDDGTELRFELFLGVPKHRAPDVLIASGMTEDGYVPVDSATLRTCCPGVYAVGDVATLVRHLRGKPRDS